MKYCYLAIQTNIFTNLLYHTLLVLSCPFPTIAKTSSFFRKMINTIKKSIKRRMPERQIRRRISSDVTLSFKKAFRKGSSMTVSMSMTSGRGDSGDTDAIAAGAARDRQAIFHETILPLIHSDKDKKKPAIPSFLIDEIELGPKLGSGEFSSVFEVRSFRLDAEFNEGLGEEESQAREMMKRCEIFHNTGKARYALKHLKDEYFARHTQDEYIQAATWVTSYFTYCDSVFI